MHKIVIETISGKALLTVEIPDVSEIIKTALERAVAQKIPLCDGSFRHLDLTGINLRGADLRNADLTGTKLVGADLQEARLDGAILEETDLSQAHLDSADLDGAQFNLARFYRTCVHRTIYDTHEAHKLLREEGAFCSDKEDVIRFHEEEEELTEVEVVEDEQTDDEDDEVGSVEMPAEEDAADTEDLERFKREANIPAQKQIKIVSKKAPANKW